MSTTGTEWGGCFAYGCPLLGTVGRGDGWSCFCHYAAQSHDLQRITQVLRANGPVVDATLSIRRWYGLREWPSAYRAIRKSLTDAGLESLLIGEADRSAERPEGAPIVRAWLARLERYLIERCEAQGDGAPQASGQPAQPAQRLADIVRAVAPEPPA